MAEEVPGTIFLAAEEYPPYTSENLKDYGITSAIVTAAFLLEGIETHYKFFPSARSYNMTRLGKMDGTLPWAKREGREKDFYYSDPVIEVDMEHFYFLKKTPLDWDPENPYTPMHKSINVATVIGYNYGEAFQDAEKRNLIKTERLEKLSQGFSMLLSGRVNAVISKKNVADTVLVEDFTVGQRAKLGSTPVSQTAPSYDYLLISKQIKHGEYYLNAFNNGLKKLHESGEYQLLMDELISGAYVD